MTRKSEYNTPDTWKADVTSKEESSGFKAYKYLMKVDAGQVRYDRRMLPKKINRAMTIPKRWAGKDPFCGIIWDKIEKWIDKTGFSPYMRRFPKRGGEWEEIFEILSEFFDEEQFTDFFMAKKEMHNPIIGLKFAYANWPVIANKFIIPGRVSFYFGPSGIGKTNGLCEMFAKIIESTNISYIGNLAYYVDFVEEHSDRMYMSDRTSEVIIEVCQQKIEGGTRPIAFVIDEMQSKVNREKGAIERDRMDQVRALADQIRKWDVCMIGVFQDSRNIPPVYRTKDGGPSRHTAAHFYHGHRLIDDGYGVAGQEIRGQDHIAKKSMVIEFTNGELLPIVDIPACTVYNHRQQATIKQDFDFLAWVEDITDEVTPSRNKGDDERWIKEQCEVTIAGIKEKRWYRDEKASSMRQEFNETLKEVKGGYKETISELEAKLLFFEYQDLKDWKEVGTWENVRNLYNKKNGTNLSKEAVRKRFTRGRDKFE